MMWYMLQHPRVAHTISQMQLVYFVFLRSFIASLFNWWWNFSCNRCVDSMHWKTGPYFIDNVITMAKWWTINRTNRGFFLVQRILLSSWNIGNRVAWLIHWFYGSFKSQRQQPIPIPIKSIRKYKSLFAVRVNGKKKQTKKTGEQIQDKALPNVNNTLVHVRIQSNECARQNEMRKKYCSDIYKLYAWNETGNSITVTQKRVTMLSPTTMTMTTTTKKRQRRKLWICYWERYRMKRSTSTLSTKQKTHKIPI